MVILSDFSIWAAEASIILSDKERIGVRAGLRWGRIMSKLNMIYLKGICK